MFSALRPAASLEPELEPFQYSRPADLKQALTLAALPGSRFLAGGTNLLDLMKGGVERPQRLIDLTELPLAAVEALPGGGVRIGALVRNSDAANHPLIRDHYPLLSRALLAGASAQLRNMATVGGNLLQRTRCGYFTDTAFSRCNKRIPGSGCAAVDGYNRMHAIFGASEDCVATSPSDMSVALNALDTLVRIMGKNGSRQVPIGDFHRLPGRTPQTDTNLLPGEIILGIDLPPTFAAAPSCYLKVRDRSSYAFALVSVAVALRLEGRTVRDCRIVLGGVAHKPWRAAAAEALLRGQPLSTAGIASAALAGTVEAQPLKDNAFKVQLAQRTLVRALHVAGGVA
jgi:xanthine dehydrogenase YagS FAD-binding subunit